MDIKGILLCAVFILGVCFLAGYDSALDKAEKTNEAERARIYCATPGHSDTFCAGRDALGHPAIAEAAGE